MSPTEELLYRLEGRFDAITMVGPVADGIRMDSAFSGTLVEGALAGAAVTGIDYFRVRGDGIGVLDAREIVEHDGATIAVTVVGYLQPPAGLPPLTAELLTDPTFAWPDADFTIEGFATFSTAAPALAHLNRTAAVHTGTVNLARGQLRVTAHKVTSPQPAAV